MASYILWKAKRVSYPCLFYIRKSPPTTFGIDFSRWSSPKTGEKDFQFPVSPPREFAANPSYQICALCKSHSSASTRMSGLIHG